MYLKYAHIADNYVYITVINIYSIFIATGNINIKNINRLNNIHIISTFWVALVQLLGGFCQGG